MITPLELYQSLITMIEWTNQQQETYRKDYFISDLSWAKEYSTIKFCVSRQSGHSRFAFELISKYYENAICVFKNFTFLNNFSNKFRISLNKMVTVSNLNILLGKGKFDSVIVDCASFFSKNEIESIYSFFKHNVSNPKFCFIFLE